MSAPSGDSHTGWKSFLCNTVVLMAFGKLAFAIAISLALNDWWAFSTDSTEVVESCSNPTIGNCNSFCGETTVVDFTITDDDYQVDDIYIPPEVHIESRESVIPGYCIATFNGACARKYWLIFRLVPILLHVAAFLLQCSCWWVLGNFVPQQFQYDAMLLHLYPSLADSALSAGAASTTKKNGAGSISSLGLESSANSLWDLNSVDAKTFDSAQGADVSGRWMPMYLLLQQISSPRYYSIFGLLETVTLVYVWGELIYPATYCDSVRPLSLYYYPILMCLLDLGKFNVYVASGLFKQGKFCSGLCALVDVGMVASSTVVTLALAGVCMMGIFSDVVAALLDGAHDGGGVSWPAAKTDRSSSAGLGAGSTVVSPLQYKEEEGAERGSVIELSA
jgi:hypothetical protein